MRESCSRCGAGTLQKDMADVVITVKGEGSYVARWCKSCAKECEGKAWFAYAKPGQKTEVDGVEPNAVPIVVKDITPVQGPKRVSGWALMKEKHPTAASVEAKLAALRSKNASAGTIKNFEGLLKMRMKEESQ